MTKRMKIAAGAEAGLFVGVLVIYLTAIAVALRNVSRTLRQVNVGVRAIEKQSEPVGDQIEDINRNLGRAAELLADQPRHSSI